MPQRGSGLNLSSRSDESAIPSLTAFHRPLNTALPRDSNGCAQDVTQETFDLNSFWITPFLSDLTVTLDAFRLGQWVGNYIFDVGADQARVPITLPQPLFSVRRSLRAARA